MRLPRTSPDSMTGAGDFTVAGLPPGLGGAGQSFRDTRARTFPILVTAHAGDNRYAFVRVDDTDPDAFPEIDGAADAGDGVDVAAFELNLRDDVPADGTVRAAAWVLPEGRGVGFVYTPTAAGGTGSAGCGCDWVAALLPSHCLRLTVLSGGGRCGCGPAAGTVLDLKRSGAVWKPRSGGTLAVCGASYTAEFSKEACDGPCLKLVKVAGSSGGGSVAPSYQGVRGCCGPDYATFGFGDPALCTAAQAADGRPSANELRVKVEWVKCPSNTVTVPCGCGTVARCFTFTTSGSSCPQLNRTWHLTLDEEASNTPETGPSYFCTWKSEEVRMGPPQHPIANPEVTYENVFQWTLTVPGRSVGGVWLRGIFQAQLNPNAVDYRADFGVPWDCKSALALTKTDVNFGGVVTPEGDVDDVCPTMPTTVTIEPDAECGEDCVRPGWAGAGWYAVADGAGGCVAAHLVEADKCDADVVIRSGPYVSEAAASAACSGSVDPGGSCCPGLTLSSFASVAHSATGGCGVVSIPPTLGGTSASWSGVVSNDGTTLSVTCGGGWAATLTVGGVAYPGAVAAVVCGTAGAEVTLDFTFPGPSPCAGTVRIVVSIPKV